MRREIARPDSERPDTFSGWTGCSARPWWPQARGSVGRQLALREPVDPAHRDVVLEVAHQAKQLTVGWVALFAINVPLYLDISTSARDCLGVGLLIFGGARIVLAGITYGVTARRLTGLTGLTGLT